MGFFAKLFGLKKAPKEYESVSSQVKFLDDDKRYSTITHTIPIVITPVRQQYVLKVDGEYRTYASKDDMSPELRAELSSIENIDSMTSCYTILIDGERHDYTNFEDIPEDIRKAMLDTGVTPQK